MCRWARGRPLRRRLLKPRRLEISDRVLSPTKVGHRKGSKTRTRVGCVGQAVAAVGRYPKFEVSLELVFLKWNPWMNAKSAPETTTALNHSLRSRMMALSRKEKCHGLKTRYLPFIVEPRSNTRHSSPHATSESTALVGNRRRNYPGLDHGRLGSRLSEDVPSHPLVSS